MNERDMKYGKASIALATVVATTRLRWPVVEAAVNAIVGIVDSAMPNKWISGMFWTRNWSCLTLFDLGFMPNIPKLYNGVRCGFCACLLHWTRSFVREKNSFASFWEFLFICFLKLRYLRDLREISRFIVGIALNHVILCALWFDFLN